MSLEIIPVILPMKENEQFIYAVTGLIQVIASYIGLARSSILSQLGMLLIVKSTVVVITFKYPVI